MIIEVKYNVPSLNLTNSAEERGFGIIQVNANVIIVKLLTQV